MAANRRPIAEVFSPGDFIPEELEAGGWTKSDLGAILGRPFQIVNQIIAGRKAITPHTARELEASLGSSAEFWMNLETSHRLHKESDPDLEISVRAREREKIASAGPSRRTTGKRA